MSTVKKKTKLVLEAGSNSKSRASFIIGKAISKETKENYLQLLGSGQKKAVKAPGPYGFLTRERPLYPVTLSYEEIKEYEVAFTQYDKNGDGVISVTELSHLLGTIGLHPSQQEVVEMITCVDSNNDGVLGFCEFIKLMSKQHNPFITPRDQFESIFRVFDNNNTGHLSRVEFKNTLFSIGQRISEQELDSILEELDQNNDGLISRREFLKIFREPGGLGH